MSKARKKVIYADLNSSLLVDFVRIYPHALAFEPRSGQSVIVTNYLVSVDAIIERDSKYVWIARLLKHTRRPATGDEKSAPLMTRPRERPVIVVDFNARTEDDRIRLNTRASSTVLGLTFSPGQSVILVDDEIAVDALMEERRGTWVARPLWTTERGIAAGRRYSSRFLVTDSQKEVLTEPQEERTFVIKDPQFKYQTLHVGDRGRFARLRAGHVPQSHHLPVGCCTAHVRQLLRRMCKSRSGPESVPAVRPATVLRTIERPGFFIDLEEE